MTLFNGYILEIQGRESLVFLFVEKDLNKRFDTHADLSTISVMIRENEHCYFFRKPSQIASSRGKQESFLDKIQQGELPTVSILPGILERIQDLRISVVTVEENEIVDTLLELFSEEQEYGLLNRLDTPTQGLLYFAKSKAVYESWKDRQRTGMISKYYIAEGVGKLKERDAGITFNMPLGHHTNGKKMHVVDATFLKSKRKQKMRGKLLEAQTTIVDADYDEESDTTLMTLMIKKGQRHQIRAHLAYLGCPIVGETLYYDGYDTELHLWSVGCTLDLTGEV